MHNVILDLIPQSGPTPAGGAAGGGTKSETVFDAELFRATLTARLAVGTAAKNAQITIDPADTATLKALQTKVGKLLDAGASQADVVAALATQLASSVAQTLGTPGADARAKLQTLFATALAPPGREDRATAPVADRALALAQRFTRLATIADAIAGQPSGQQKRIAGHVLDAQGAKDIPAPTTTSDAALAASTLAQNTAAPATPVPLAAQAGGATNAGLTTNAATYTTPVTHAAQIARAPVQTAPAAVLAPAAGAQHELPSPAIFAAAADIAVAPPAHAPSGDGRHVTIGARAAIAAGGDTGLGRILSRAVLAADARSPATAAARADLTAAAEKTPAALTAPAAMPQTQAAAGRKSDATSAPATPVKASSGAALSAFVRSFEAALDAGHATEAARPAQHDEQPETGATPAHAGVDSALSALAGTPPNVERMTATTASTPAPAPAFIPIDHSAIADQVLRGAFLRNVGKTSEIRLTLVPEALGDVTVKLVVSDGKVAAHVVAETPEVCDALVAAQPQLTKSLAEAGLKLTTFDVDLSGSGFAGFSQQQNAPQQNRNPTRGTNVAGESDDPADEAPLAAIPSFGPSITGKPSAGDYNYLV
jgi:flagellar hook-length control protein FliK